MSSEPNANSFRAAVLAGNGARTKPLIVQEKHARVDHSIDGLHAVSVPRGETRRQNQRGGDRHRLSDTECWVRYGRRKRKVELVNLSGGGAMIRADFELMLWDRVLLLLGEGGELECAVRWIKSDRVGLEFAHETQIDCDPETRDELLRAVIRKSFPDLGDAPLEHPKRRAEDDPEVDPESVKRRAAERHPLVWTGVVYHDFDQVEPVRLRNISTTGALVQSGEPLPEGATVYLDLGDAGRHGATVRWTRGDQSGLAFDKPFDIHLLSRSRPDVATDGAAGEFGTQEPWAPGWKRATMDELARSLGG